MLKAYGYFDKVALETIISTFISKQMQNSKGYANF
jgi:hypothetical protein